MTLYTTHCPKCKVLEAKLQQKGLQYDVVEDEAVMIERGFMEAPKLEIDDGEVLGFSEAVNWLKNN